METNFLHSGSSGDVVYALPTLEAFHQKSNSLVNLYLNPNEHASYYQGAYHPNGTSRLTKEGIDFLVPLLNSMNYINKASLYVNQKIDVSLDLFREMKINLSAGHIARWYFYTLAINRNLSIPWIKVESDYHGAIVVNRSLRYRNNSINYGFLNNLPYKIWFVGLEEEFIVSRREIPKLEWIKTETALDVAKVINGARMFIGNQSFCFAVAEGLKTTRILEVCPWAPNVIPHGETGWDFYHQEMFEVIVTSILSQPPAPSNTEKQL